METEDLEETVRKSKEMLNDESARTKGKGKSSVKDPSGRNTEMEDSDIECLKRRYPFLAEFSDTFIRTTGPAELMKMESTSIKMVDRERTREVWLKSLAYPSGEEGGKFLVQMITIPVFATHRGRGEGIRAVWLIIVGV